jgi:hypothetical protein
MDIVLTVKLMCVVMTNKFTVSSASIPIVCFNVGDTRTEKEEKEEASEPFGE